MCEKYGFLGLLVGYVQFSQVYTDEQNKQAISYWDVSKPPKIASWGLNVTLYCILLRTHLLSRDRIILKN